MNRWFAVLLVLVLVVVGVGFYRGWFALSRPAAEAGSNKVNVNLTVDPDKVKQDAEAVQDKTAELTGTVTTENDRAGKQAAENAKSRDPERTR
jgi:hypothetical protein